MSKENNKVEQSAQICLPLVLGGKSDEACLYDYWRVLLKRKKMINRVSLLIVLIASSYIFWMKPVYVAEASLMYAQGSSTVDSVSTDQDGGRSSSSSASASSGIGTEEEAVAILTSRVFIEQFIVREKLMPVLFPDEWALSEDGGKVISKVSKPSSFLKACKVFNDEILSVTKDKVTGLSQLEIRWRNAEQASDWAALLIKQINDYMKKRDIGYAKKGLDYVNNELRKTSVTELQQSLYEMIEQYMKIIMLADISTEYAFRVIDPPVTPEVQVWTILKRILLIIFIAVTALLVTALFALFLDWIDENKNKD